MTGLYAHKVLPNGAAHAITVLSDHVEKALK
jgi:hypothetical protein